MDPPEDDEFDSEEYLEEENEGPLNYADPIQVDYDIQSLDGTDDLVDSDGEPLISKDAPSSNKVKRNRNLAAGIQDAPGGIDGKKFRLRTDDIESFDETYGEPSTSKDALSSKKEKQNRSLAARMKDASGSNDGKKFRLQSDNLLDETDDVQFDSVDLNGKPSTSKDAGGFDGETFRFRADDIESLDETNDPLFDPDGEQSTPKDARSSKKVKRHRIFADGILDATGYMDGKKFRLRADVYLKKFKNQKSFEKCGAVNVDGDTVGEIITKVWECCSKFTHRAVRFTESTDSRPEASWEDALPCLDECDRFLVFQDKSSKRNFSPSKVDSNNLVSWLSREISVIVYKYSETITTLQRWNQVENQLLRPLEKDRSGAESVASINQLKEELKKTHGKYLSGADVNWGCWASWISSKPYDQRDDLKNQAPPEHLINLFSSVPVHSDTLLEKARLDLQVANTVNGAYRIILQELKNDHQQLGNVVNVIGERISMLEIKQKEYDEMLQAMRNTVAVKETKFSVELARSVTDCLDVDHDEF